MLYDRRWEIKTKPAAFTLADFIAWLETKDPDEAYDFDCGYCCMGQYMAARGRAYQMRTDGGEGSNYWQSCEQVFGDPLDVGVLLCKPHTFGNALDRAREFAAS